MHTIELKPIIMKTKQWNLNAKFHFNLKTSTNFEKHNFVYKYISIWFCFCIIANICMYVLKKIKRSRETPEGNEEGGNSCVNDRGIVVPTQELGFLSVFRLLCFPLCLCEKVNGKAVTNSREIWKCREKKREKGTQRHTNTKESLRLYGILFVYLLSLRAPFKSLSVLGRNLFWFIRIRSLWFLAL